jgi:hypothetical protein
VELDWEDCCPEPFEEELLDCDEEDDDEEEDEDCDCDDELDDEVDWELEVDEDGEPEVEGMPDEDVVCCIVHAASTAATTASRNRFALRQTLM